MRIEKVNSHWEFSTSDNWEQILIKALQSDREALGSAQLLAIAEHWFALLIRDPNCPSPIEIFQQFAEHLDNMSKYIHYHIIPTIKKEERNNAK